MFDDEDDAPPAEPERAFEIQITERQAGFSARNFRIPVGLMFSVQNGNPPPHDRQYFQLVGRRALPDVAAKLAWKPGRGYEGPSPQRLAFAVIGQGVSSLTQDQLDDGQVREILDAWLAWAKRPALTAEGAKEGK